MSDLELATLIFDTLSDGYDDEEYKENEVNALVSEMEASAMNNIPLLTIKSALLELCRRIEELEE